MSDKSSHALIMEKEGFLKPLYEWQGTLENTWCQCVENNDWQPPEEDIESNEKKCDVYLLEINIFGKILYKVGISQNIIQRFNLHKNSIPFASFKFIKSFPARNKIYAEKYETDFILACKKYLLAGEWFDFDRSDSL